MFLPAATTVDYELGYWKLWTASAEVVMHGKLEITRSPRKSNPNLDSPRRFHSGPARVFATMASVDKTELNGDSRANGVDLGAQDGHSDVLVIGAGFSGISALYRARKLGLRAKVLEVGSDFGGVWHWNRYPGARVDSEIPFYQLNIPEAWRTWDFSERFPHHTELREYFAHLDHVLDLRKDVSFDSEVSEAVYDTSAARWTVKTSRDSTWSAKYLILATGLLHRRYTPDFPGLENYKGRVIHSSSWPEGVFCKGKKVAIIGGGATSVQIVQELAKETADGGSFGPDIFAMTEEKRDELFEELWRRGAFSFLLGNFDNIMLDEKANRLVYDFWAKKIRARFTNPIKRDLMVPLEPVYPICTKRPPLEHDYYDCLDMEHVEITTERNGNSTWWSWLQDLTLSPAHKSPSHQVWLMWLTGLSLTSMGLKNKDGIDIKDIWRDGVRTYMGICMNGFPSAFIVYSPQAPTAFSNGPTIIECQCDLVFNVIEKLEKDKSRSFEPTSTAEDEWKDLITTMIKGTVYGVTDSWWNGGNIPGKKPDVLSFAGGINQYEKICQERIDGWHGITVEAR
ncbi:hypothetical protein NM208_g5205 [Fusarium decemcellulare]|uniref:Uncharacterized protein n=2 Tax=Fusarium decemcellulare TaxID=57161 RepID=A0ACC1S8N2_9HYPO|nr:hypothetical protein NM208_g7563 [Fusarium decemcellulare]KAJ3540114.1 hypothetical protein NM208_g5205 [Fusarium decemcellulare]